MSNKSVLSGLIAIGCFGFAFASPSTFSFSIDDISQTGDVVKIQTVTKGKEGFTGINKMSFEISASKYNLTSFDIEKLKKTLVDAEVEWSDNYNFKVKNLDFEYWKFGKKTRENIFDEANFDEATFKD